MWTVSPWPVPRQAHQIMKFVIPSQAGFDKLGIFILNLIKQPVVMETTNNKKQKIKTMKTGVYRHYKGKNYEVIGVARHSETLEEMVVYKALYESEFGKDTLWVRPKAMFLEKVINDGKEVGRFKFID
jgi:hypothetical protein